MSLVKKIPIVYYHSIGPKIKDWNRNYLTTSIDAFERHLNYYKKNYNVISLGDYYNIRIGNLESPKNPLVITLDDGYLDNWICVFPLLKKYNLKVTIFVTPENVDERNSIRPNLNDFWKGNGNKRDLATSGYMSWDELNVMDKSGLVDIQSHTMTHTKYFVSDKIINFHHMGADSLYAIGNIFQKEKPYSISNPNFQKLIPFGTPLFEEKSSVIANKVTINPDFIKECISNLKNYDGSNFSDAFKKIEPIYNSYKVNNKLISARESNEEFRKRLEYEIVESKKEIEKRLNKKVEFLCWPHGDNSNEAHEFALKSGYKATTIGKLDGDTETVDRIGKRIGFRPYMKSETIGLIRLKTIIKETEGDNSAAVIKKFYKLLRFK